MSSGQVPPGAEPAPEQPPDGIDPRFTREGKAARMFEILLHSSLIDVLENRENSPDLALVRLQRLIGTKTHVSSETVPRLYPQLAGMVRAAARRGDATELQTLLALGASPNDADHKTGATPLHIAAANGARQVVGVLIRDARCDFLSRDRQGRLASELADIFSRDAALARLLKTKEARQARTTGSYPRRRQSEGRPAAVVQITGEDDDD